MIKNNKAIMGLATLVGVVGLSVGPAYADTTAAAHNHMYTANLQPLNKSGDTGNATAQIITNGDGTFTVKTTGASPSLAHAQHIHIGGTNSCPTSSADKDKDGLINTTEGAPAYGPIEISLTTSGDASKDSGLAVDRFPVADAQGNINYERTFPLPQGVTEDMLAKGVVVTHGVSELFDDKAKYDGAKKSDIPKSEALPLEATIPATCGKLVAAPVGAASTGAGSTAGTENQAAFVAAALSLGAAVVLLGGRSLTAKRQ